LIRDLVLRLRVDRPDVLHVHNALVLHYAMAAAFLARVGIVGHLLRTVLVAGVDRAQVMYNLTVHDDHDYFVGSGQWLVHNDSCQVGYGETPLSRKVRQWRIDNGNFLNSNVAAHDSLDKRAKRRILSDA